MPLFRLISGFQALGEGVLKMPVYEVAKLPVINPNLLTNDLLNEIENVFEKIQNYEVTDLFKEIGSFASKINLQSVNQYRKMIDNIVLIRILGLSETEMLDLYKAIIDLLRARVERARSVVRRKKKKSVDVEALANGIVDRLNTKIGKFPNAYLTDYKGLWSKEIKIPNGQPIIGSDVNGFYVQVRSEEIYRSWNREEAKFVYFAALTGASSVKLPLDKQAVKVAVEAFEKDYSKLKEEVNSLLLTLIPDVKVRKNVEDRVWYLLFSKRGV
jgi:tRNA threonylcarbamoyladenosine modification (KEOPS) complex  Pcc1 subunit